MVPEASSPIPLQLKENFGDQRGLWGAGEGLVALTPYDLPLNRTNQWVLKRRSKACLRIKGCPILTGIPIGGAPVALGE